MMGVHEAKETPPHDALTPGALRYEGIDKKEDIMNAKKLLIPMFALALGTTVAAQAQATDVRAAAQDSVRQGVTINVVNNNWLAMRVYVIVGSVRYRLGTVNGLGRQTLKVPVGVVSNGNDIRLVAVPFAQLSATYTREMLVYPGDELEYRIEQRLALSNLFRL
ncbi:MAG: hypothetical protein ACE10G_13915 [Gemmatimonadales bacterium]